MPISSYEPKVDRDWQYEQVRSEIKRLREVLNNAYITAEERAIAQSQLVNHLARPTARRSTRIPAPVRLKIVGQSRVGTQQIELTSAVTVNCHGCLCLSRHEYPPNSWVTLEVSNLHTGRKSAPERANVRFIRLPGNPGELYNVGVELETPANIWGVESVPEDWLLYLDPASVAGGTTEGVRPAPEIQTAAQTEQMKRIPEYSNGFEISAPVSSTPESAPSQPNRESILKIADGVWDCDTILVPARVGFLHRLNKELADAGESLFDRTAAFVTRTQTIPQSLGVKNGAAAIRAPGEMKAFSKKLVSGQVSVRAGRDVRYGIEIDTRKMLEPAVTGWFRASGGAVSDIALVLATEHEFENLIQGREARVLFAIDGVSNGEFHVSIAQSGTYILALNNRFSIFMPRIFTANIDLLFSTP